MESLSMNSLRFKVPSTSSHLASNLLATQSNVATNGSGLMNRIVAEALAEDTSNGGDLSPNDAQVFMESKKIYDFVQQQQRHRDSTFATGYYSSPFATVNRSNVNSGNSSFTTGHHQSNLVSCYTPVLFDSFSFFSSPSPAFFSFVLCSLSHERTFVQKNFRLTRA